MAFSEINRRKLVLLLILTYTGIGIASSGSVSDDWPSFFNGNTTWNEKFDLDDSSMAPSKIDFHTPLELHDQNNIKVLLRFNPGKTLNYFQELTYLLFSFSESSSITWIMAMVCKAVWLLLLFAFSWVLDEIMTNRVDHPPRFSQHTIYKSPRQMFDFDICLPMLEKMISSVATDLVTDLDENILYVEANRTSSQSSSNANKATLSNGNQTVMALHSPSLPILEKMISSVATDLLKDLDENILYEEAKRATSQSNPNANTAPLSDGNHNIMSPRQMFDVDVCLPMLEKMISSVATDLVTDLDENILYEEANRASSQSSSNANKATLSNGNQTAMALHSPSLPILKKTIPSVATDLVKDLDESILYEEAKRTTSQSNPNANTAPLSDGNQNVMGLQSPRQMSDVDICLPMLEKMISRQISNVDTCPVLEKGYRGKRVIKVKALKVAEAAKRREEEKENERKMKKEAFKHAIATRKKEKTPENELNKKKEKGARKRQKVEDERKLRKK